MFHRHDWSEVQRRFTGKVLERVKMERCSEELLRQMLFGVTVIELRCEKCGDRKTVKAMGDLRRDAGERIRATGVS